MQNILSKENFAEILENLERKFGREGLLRLEYQVRLMVARYQKNHKGASNKLNQIIASLTKDLKVN